MAHRFHYSVIRPTALQIGYRHFLEIGVGKGKHTKRLMQLCNQVSGSLVCIDPDPSLPLWLYFQISINLRTKLIKKTSLEVLPEFVEKRRFFDCIIVDGDHNWYTVFNELQYLGKLLSPMGTVYLHDIAWPYARRDMYYSPERIPPQFRHPCARKGMIKEQSELAENDGILSHLYNAQYEGGARNGVLTAVEDFLEQEARTWNLHVLEENQGLGCLTRRQLQRDEVNFAHKPPHA